MSPPRNLVSNRRLLSLVALLAVLFGLAMLHPYPRQSLFGPTVRGKPWCVWEDEVRRFVNRDAYANSWTGKFRRWAKIESPPMKRKDLFDHAEMTPILVGFLDDPDPKVRTQILFEFTRCLSLRTESALPALRKRMGDDVAENRIWAAIAVWQIAKDKEAIVLLLREVNDARNSEDDRERAVGFFHWSDVWEHSPTVLHDLAKLTGDRHQPVRRIVMEAAPKFGLKSVPILKQGLADPDLYVRRQAAIGLGKLGVNDKDVLPILLTMLAECEGREDLAHAARALGGLRADAVVGVPGLTKLLKHADPTVRDAATTALAEIEAARQK